MQEDNQNNQRDWRKDLNDLDAIAGEEAPAFTSSWARLQTKLQEKPQRVTPFWFLVAAACVAIIILIGSINRKDDNSTETIVQKKIEEPAKIVLYQPVANTKKRISTTESPHHLTSYRVKKPITHSSKEIIVVAPPAHTDSTAVAATYAIIDTPTALPKKKLRVVHINELENNTVQRRNQMVRNTPSDKIIKIHLAPSN